MNNVKYLDDVMAKYGNRVFSVRNAPKDAVYIGRGKKFNFWKSISNAWRTYS